MTTIKTIRRFKRKNFLIEVNAVEDDMPDASFDRTGEIARKLDRGSLVAFGAIATVYCNGTRLGRGSIWGCIYKDPSEFQDHFGMSQSRCGSYFHDIVKGAISESRKIIREIKTIHVK